MTVSAYRGRFAPSPTGPLHFGSLIAAVASFADARHRDGTWLVRIDDVDETRCNPVFERELLAGLQAFGMHWDEPPQRQSERTSRYQGALQRLIDRSSAFRCNCSRKTVAALGAMGRDGPIYPGSCRNSPPPADADVAWRLKVEDRETGFDDRICGRVTQNLQRDVGDFVVQRLDGYAAYQLAVVVDDHDQGITDVVRGADLLWSTPRQLWLQQLLDIDSPRYAHLPLAYGADGHKLSKRDGADPVGAQCPVDTLLAAWRHLGQQAPASAPSDVQAFWQWAVPRWQIERVPQDARSES